MTTAPIPMATKRPRDAANKSLRMFIYLNRKSVDNVERVKEIYEASLGRKVSTSLVMRRALSGLRERLDNLVDGDVLRSDATSAEEYKALLNDLA